MYSLASKEHQDVFASNIESIVRELYGLVRKNSFHFSLDDRIEMKFIPSKAEDSEVDIVARGVYYDMTYGGLYLRYDDMSKANGPSPEIAYINNDGRLYKDGGVVFGDRFYTVEGDGLGELYSRVKQYAENADMRAENIKAIRELIDKKPYVKLDLLPVNVTDFDENGKPVDIKGFVEGISYIDNEFDRLDGALCAMILVGDKSIEYPLYYMKDFDIMHIRSSMFDVEKREERSSIVCLPSRRLIQELIDSCQWNWNEKNGGYDITGPNGNNIFLPELGYKYDNYNKIYDGGSGGHYWSSTETSGSCGYYLVFYSGRLRIDYDYKSDYYFPVRLVQASGFDTKMKGFVDLGLPSGTLWAEKNASKEYMNWNQAQDYVKELNVKLNKDAKRGLSL